MFIQVPDLVVVALPLIMSTVLALAVLGLVCSLVALILRKQPVTAAEGENSSHKTAWLLASKTAQLASMGFWLALTALHLMAWHLYLGRDSAYHLHGLSYLSSFIALLLAWQLLRLWQRTGSRRGAMVSPLGMQLLQVIGLSCCCSLLSEGPKPLFPLTPPGELVVSKTARTDQGTPVPLYDREIESGQLEDFYLATRGELSNMTRQAMFREQAAPQVNCHGWVFSGQHTIKGEDVPIILKENGYQQVDQPNIKDLVVYVDDNERVLHTGLVCGFFGEGTPLIQGKWGITGIYVHLVDEQPYSTNYRFYRSVRNGHLLNSCEPASETVAQGSELAQNSMPFESTSSQAPLSTKPARSKPNGQRLAALWIGEPKSAD